MFPLEMRLESSSASNVLARPCFVHLFYKSYFFCQPTIFFSLVINHRTILSVNNTFKTTDYLSPVATGHRFGDFTPSSHVVTLPLSSTLQSRSNGGDQVVTLFFTRECIAGWLPWPVRWPLSAPCRTPPSAFSTRRRALLLRVLLELLKFNSYCSIFILLDN